MNIQIISRDKETLEECDYRDAVVINIDGEKVFKVRDDEPEDSNLSRSFSDVYKIGDLMKKAYEAGKNGEVLNIEYIESEDV